MGWVGPVVDHVEHEGWVVELFADGIEGLGGTSSQGVCVRAPDKHSDGDWLPGSAVLGWAAACACGWRGPRWTRVAAADAKPAARYLATDDDRWGELAEPDEDRLLEEWRSHVAPWCAVEDVADAASAAARATAELDATVRAAISSGATWQQIARAAGVSRRVAEERWGRDAPPVGSSHGSI